MKLIKTNHGEQALVLDEKTNLIIQQSITFFYNYKIGSVDLRKKSLEFLTLTISEKQNFLDKIVSKCECRETTARAWARGARKPNPLAQKVIAEILGISRDKLFQTQIKA